MKKAEFIFCLFCFLSTAVFAQIPAGYYNGTQGKIGRALKDTLNDIISGHTAFPYTSSSTDVWDILSDIDEDPANTANVILIYKQSSIPKANTANGANANNNDYWNREHLFPVSLGNFSTSDDAGTDVHHLRPSDRSVNADRANLDFDNGGSAHPEATQCSFDFDSWEPPANVKGDIARSIFYMAVRYEGEGGDPDLEIVNTTGSALGNGEMGKLSTLLLWHAQDSVDQAERDRNDAIYYQYQGNRNPFVDHPEFVTFVFDSANAAVVDAEPTNHATKLSLYQSANLSWTAPSIAPSGYLIKMSDVGFTAIQDPVDGSFEADSPTRRNVSGTISTYDFTGLTPGQTYYFKIYPYNGVGSTVNYLQLNPPTVSISL